MEASARVVCRNSGQPTVSGRPSAIARYNAAARSLKWRSTRVSVGRSIVVRFSRVPSQQPSRGWTRKKERSAHCSRGSGNKLSNGHSSRPLFSWPPTPSGGNEDASSSRTFRVSRRRSDRLLDRCRLHQTCQPQGHGLL